METLKDRFNRNIKAKATIGAPFTMDDVARSLEVPSNELRSSWFTPFLKDGTIVRIGTEPSRNPQSNGRHINLYSGTYYLEEWLAEREAEREEERLERLAENYARVQSAPRELSEKDEEVIHQLLTA